LWAKTT